MKKIATITKQTERAGKKLLFAQRDNLIMPQNSSVTDLPDQIQALLIASDKIRFRAISWCMFPVIWAGDVLNIMPIKPEDAIIGDIIAYKSAGRIFAHRLIKCYEKEGKLYIITCSEEFRNSRVNNYGGIPAENILGKVTEIKRGKLCFRPDDIRLSLAGLVKGRLKLSLWTLMQGIKQYFANILITLQRLKLYRSFFKKLIRNKISFFIGTPVIKDVAEINSFCFYHRFSDFFKDIADIKGLYNIIARIDNRPVGSMSFSSEEENNFRRCTLSNLVVRIPYRGGGIGNLLIEKVLYLCNRFNVDEIRVSFFEEEKIARNLFDKLGFRIIR